jgi:hypothetical protein
MSGPVDLEQEQGESEVGIRKGVEQKGKEDYTLGQGHRGARLSLARELDEQHDRQASQ